MRWSAISRLKPTSKPKDQTVTTQQPFVPLREEMLDSPKVQRLPPEVFRFWVNALLAANRWDYVVGQLPDVGKLAFWLRLTEGECAALIGELEEAGLVDRRDDGLYMHDWAEHRYVKDPGATARKRKEREAKKTGDRDKNVTGHGNVTDRSRPCHDQVTPLSRLEVRSKKEEEEVKPPLPPVTGDGRVEGLEPFQSDSPPPAADLSPEAARLIAKAGERWGGAGADVASDLLGVFDPAVAAYAANAVFDKFGRKFTPGAARYWRTICQNHRDGPPAEGLPRAPSRPAAPIEYVVCKDPQDLIPPALRKNHVQQPNADRNGRGERDGRTPAPAES